MCPETSLVISNMLTWLLPLKTADERVVRIDLVRFLLVLADRSS